MHSDIIITISLRQRSNCSAILNMVLKLESRSSTKICVILLRCSHQKQSQPCVTKARE